MPRRVILGDQKNDLEVMKIGQEGGLKGGENTSGWKTPQGERTLIEEVKFDEGEKRKR